MRKASPSFQQRLKVVDKDLSCRWSRERGQWVIEAKVVGGNTDGLIPPTKRIKIGSEFKEILMSEFSDRYIQYHNKTYPLFYFNGEPGSEIINKIKKMDCFHLNKKEDFLENIVKNEELVAKSKEREDKNMTEAIANDLYDTMKRRCGETSVGNGPVSDSRWY